MSNQLLFGIFIVSAILIFSFTIIYLLLMTSRHNKRRIADKELSDKYNKLPDSILVLYNSLLDRRQSSITNFLIFQVTTKVFGFTGVLYSIYGFGLNFLTDASKALSVLVALVSLVCVIIALYLSPERRISEYIVAWRKYDKLVTDMIGRFPFYNGKHGDCPLILAEAEKLSREISDIESDITSDAS